MDNKTKDDKVSFTPLWGYNIKVRKNESEERKEVKEESFTSNAKSNNQSYSPYNKINNSSTYENETLIIRKIDFLTIPKVTNEQIRKAIVLIDNAFLYLKNIILKMSGRTLEINCLQTGYKTDLLSSSILPLDDNLIIKPLFINNSPIFLKLDKSLIDILSLYLSKDNGIKTNDYSEKSSLFINIIKELLTEKIKDEVTESSSDEEEIKGIINQTDDSCISIPYCFSIQDKEYYLTFVFSLQSFLYFIKEERIISFNVSSSFYQNKNAFVSLYETNINEEVIKELKEGSLIKTHFYNNDLLSLYYNNRLIYKGDGVKVIKDGQSFYGIMLKERNDSIKNNTSNCFIALGSALIESEKIRDNDVITLDSKYSEGLKLIYNNNVVAIGEMVLKGGFYYFRVTKVLDKMLPIK